MKQGINNLVERINAHALEKGEVLVLETSGIQRTFHLYHWKDDTFIFEADALKNLDAHLPMLIIRKQELLPDAPGYLTTLTTGNHSVAAIPLLNGRLWQPGSVPRDQHSHIMHNRVVCANLVKERIELTQRELPWHLVVEADVWLQGIGFAMDEVIISERTDALLEHYRCIGQEWRIKPLVWTRMEMERALNASRTTLNSCIRYYHSAKGVHFLTYSQFQELSKLASANYPQFLRCLHELTGIFEGCEKSYLRSVKFHGHHEVELFGLQRGMAYMRIVPELEVLAEKIRLEQITPAEATLRFQKITALYKESLDRPELVDEGSDDFVETMYMHLTGAVYYSSGTSITPAFDDRRTALPGATYFDGVPEFHPGADLRTQMLLINVEQMLSRGEIIEYANIYALKSNETDWRGRAQAKSGATREIVFKTNRRPVCHSLIEKRLAHKKAGYGSYMLSRVHAFKALGVNFGEYRLLLQSDSQAGQELNYFIRDRSPGEPLHSIPAMLLRPQPASGTPVAGRDPDVIFALALLMGNAAAQNMVLKKYHDNPSGCYFGVGKEIFEFDYDIRSRRAMPARVWLCSVRGSCGWQDYSHSQENLAQVFEFYLTNYANVLLDFWEEHMAYGTLETFILRFLTGFEIKTREMYWLYSLRREQFDAFDPKLPGCYNFCNLWRFALWALVQQTRQLDKIKSIFTNKATVMAERRMHNMEQLENLDFRI